MNTLSDQQQHTSLLFIKHSSLSCSLFLFSSTEGTFSTQKIEYSMRYIYYKNQSINQSIHCTQNTEKHGNCAWVGLWILPSVGFWPQDLINIASNVFFRLSIGENIALCAESIYGLTLPHCLHRPVPSPAEEACGHVVGGHVYAPSPRRNIFCRV